MKQPEKWKETIDPFSIKFNSFILKEVLGYPHARNDVFYCSGIFHGKEVKCFLKYASKKDSNLLHEVKTINALDFEFLPQILDFDNDGKFVLTQEVEGDRLSYILQNSTDTSLEYMFEYGQTLAKIHKVKTSFPNVAHRKFFDIPTKEYLNEKEISFVYNYLLKNKPQKVNSCFCHGDFHYANILWKNKHLTAVLDWELSGIGNREFDIAWAIINRPGQKFLTTQEEVDMFLSGYKSMQDCNLKYVNYYMILIYSHFISVDKDNLEYQIFVRKLLSEKIKEVD